ncbi:MAG: right-handed parallel beta-helix repeat-containing protein [Candidatus Nanopelagicales bacterium]
MGAQCAVDSTTITGSSGTGVTSNGSGLRIENSTILGNGLSGVLVNSGTNPSDLTVIGCAIKGNGSAGIDAGVGVKVVNCTVTGNGITVASPGVRAGDASSILDTTVSESTAGGIVVGSGATVSRCTVVGNTGDGIAVGGGSSILDCTARLNTGDGVRFTFRCLVRGNNSSSNTLAQFHATDTDNRIEANAAASGARGFDIDAGGNIITRNSSTGATTNWDVVGGNVCQVFIAATGAAISGNSGGAAPGSTDPSANFTY